jgi:hypothetical protein
MTVAYSSTSPYAKTSITNGHLDIINFRNISQLGSDNRWTITAKYEFRPDLLANDLYGDSSLWWVFAVRNKNIIKDPIFDMVPGTSIYLPQVQTIKSDLGI